MGIHSHLLSIVTSLGAHLQVGGYIARHAVFIYEFAADEMDETSISRLLAGTINLKTQCARAASLARDISI